EQLDRALVGNPRAPAGLLEADGGCREHVRIAETACDLRRGAERLDGIIRAPGAEAGCAQLELRLGSPSHIVDAELQRSREASVGLVEGQRRQGRAAR